MIFYKCYKIIKIFVIFYYFTNFLGKFYNNNYYYFLYRVYITYYLNKIFFYKIIQ